MTHAEAVQLALRTAEACAIVIVVMFAIVGVAHTVLELRDR